MHTGHAVMSLPVLTFIDGFGIYRNTARQLMGMYQVPALPTKHRINRGNIFPFVLGPHGSNFDDVVDAIQCLVPLDKGIMMEINGKQTLVSVFTMCYTADMPQQDKNTGTKGPTGLKFCRFYFMGQQHVVDQNILDPSWDNTRTGRFHHSHLEMRNEMDHLLKTGEGRRQYGTQWGISENRPHLFDLTPALDVIMSRPPDPAHSEFKGMSSRYQKLLLDVVLTNNSKLEYGRVLRTWPFPAGWSHLTSPLYHLKNWDLSAHAKWSVIAPALLRAWLKKDRIDPNFWKALRRRHDEKGAEDDHDPVTEDDLVGFLVDCYAKLAHSNNLLMGTRISAGIRQNFNTIIGVSRERYIFLCRVAAEAISDNPRVGRAFSTRVRATTLGSIGGPSRAGTVLTALTEDAAASQSVPRSMSARPSRMRRGSGADIDLDSEDATPQDQSPVADPDPEEPRTLPARAAKYIASSVRPNVHLAMHYHEIATEYGMPSLLNVLAEEIFHRWFKKEVSKNHRDIERILLRKANIIQIIRFVLLNAYAHDDPGLTTQMGDLARDVPSLFEFLLQHADKGRLLRPFDDDDNEMDVGMPAFSRYVRPSVIGKVPSKLAARTTHSVAYWRLSAVDREAEARLAKKRYPANHVVPDPFRRQLRAAYEKDYGMQGILRFVPGALQYSGRVAFSDRYVLFQFLSQSCLSISHEDLRNGF